PLAVDQPGAHVLRALVEVAREERRAARRTHLELARLVALGDDPQVHPGKRAAHGAGAGLVLGPVAGQLARLGLSVAVADRESRGVLERGHDLRVERLTGG